MVAPPNPARPPNDGPVLVEGGHFTLAARPPDAARGEAVQVPGAGLWWAGTTETTRLCLKLAVEEAGRIRAGGGAARIGLLVGDLAIPAGSRPAGGDWALPESYRAILAAANVETQDVETEFAP